MPSLKSIVTCVAMLVVGFGVPTGSARAQQAGELSEGVLEYVSVSAPVVALANVQVRVAHPARAHPHQQLPCRRFRDRQIPSHQWILFDWLRLMQLHGDHGALHGGRVTVQTPWPQS